MCIMSWRNLQTFPELLKIVETRIPQLSSQTFHFSSQGKKLSALWTRNQEVIVNRIRNQWKLTEFSEEEVHTVCGILEVNCFEVGGRNGTSARALFPEAYLMCHDCVPNTNHTDDPITHELTVRTTKAMKKGEVISLSYAYTLQVLIIFCFLLHVPLHDIRLFSTSTGNIKKTTTLERGEILLVHLWALQKRRWIVDSRQHDSLSQVRTWLHSLGESAWRKCWVEVNFTPPTHSFEMQKARFLWFFNGN